MKDAIKENRDFLKLYSQTRQETFIRLQKAFQNFFRRWQGKERRQNRESWVSALQVKGQIPFNNISAMQRLLFNRN